MKQAERSKELTKLPLRACRHVIKFLACNYALQFCYSELRLCIGLQHCLYYSNTIGRLHTDARRTSTTAERKPGQLSLFPQPLSRPGLYPVSADTASVTGRHKRAPAGAIWRVDRHVSQTACLGELSGRSTLKFARQVWPPGTYDTITAFCQSARTSGALASCRIL